MQFYFNFVYGFWKGEFSRLRTKKPLAAYVLRIPKVYYRKYFLVLQKQSSVDSRLFCISSVADIRHKTPAPNQQSLILDH